MKSNEVLNTVLFRKTSQEDMGLTTPTERKLYAIFQKRWGEMSNTELRNPVVRIKSVTNKWISYISDLGMSFVEATSQQSRPVDENHYVIDPASQLDPIYIVVNPELALKILALGELP